MWRVPGRVGKSEQIFCNSELEGLKQQARSSKTGLKMLKGPIGNGAAEDAEEENGQFVNFP